MLASLWKFLTSRNTGIVLLIAVSLLLLVGALVPNPALMAREDVQKLKLESPFLYWVGENFNSMKVGQDPVFGAVGLFLVISTTLCSIDRFMKRRKSFDSVTIDARASEKRISAEFADGETIRQTLVALLRRQRWKVIHGDGFPVYARKGDLGFMGSLFFHAVLVTLVAGLIVFHFSGFYATMVISEGQEIMLSLRSLSKIDKTPYYGISLPKLSFLLRQFSSEYAGETAVDYTADFLIRDQDSGETWDQQFKINEPFNYRGIDFMMNEQGYSPHFVLYKNGTMVYEAVIALKPESDTVDSFSIDEEGMAVTAQFFPDMKRKEDGSVYSERKRPKNPYYGLEIRKKGERIFRGLIGKGQEVAFGDYRLEFRDLRHWITLNLVRETGLGFFFVSAMIGLAGILVRMMDQDRRLVIEKEAGGRFAGLLHFDFVSRHFTGMLEEEVGLMIKRLGGRIAGGEDVIR